MNLDVETRERYGREVKLLRAELQKHKSEHSALKTHWDRITEQFLWRFIIARNGDRELAFRMIIEHLVLKDFLQ